MAIPTDASSSATTHRSCEPTRAARSAAWRWSLASDRSRISKRTDNLAAGAWVSAALIYLTTERIGASAFSPPYDYAANYISDLGVPVCGTHFDGRSICSPLHALVNGGFALEGSLFFVAALAISRSLTSRTKTPFVAFAALNCIGNWLIAIYPETAVAGPIDGLTFHVLGAILAIVCGNGAILLSAWPFGNRRWGWVHRTASVVLPLLAFGSLAMLAKRGGGTILPEAVWERASVYTITVWEFLSAAYVIRRRGRPCI